MNQRNTSSISSDTLKGMGGKEMSRQEVEIHMRNGNFKAFQDMGIESRKVVEDFLKGKSAKPIKTSNKEPGKPQESGAHLGNGKTAKDVQSKTKGRMDQWFESVGKRFGVEKSELKSATVLVSGVVVLAVSGILTLTQTDVGQSFLATQTVSKKKAKKPDVGQEESDRESKGVVIMPEVNNPSEHSTNVILVESPKEQPNKDVINEPSGVIRTKGNMDIKGGFEMGALTKELSEWSREDANKPINPGLSQSIR